jgi:hypothetical protein
MSNAEPWIGSNIEEAPLRIDVGGRRHAEAAGQRAGEVGQDIGMEVGRHDGIEALRLQRHPHRHRIDQHLVPRDIWEFFRDLFGDLVPHHHAMPLRVRFCNDGEEFSRARLRQLEGIAHDALDADAGEDGDFGADFLRQPAMYPSAAAGIFAFGVFAHDHPVEIAGADMRSGEVMPGRIRVGRTLAYWSKPWQIGSAGPTA